MKNFSNDADILRYEPKLFTELYLSSQVLAKGSGGVLSGTSLCKAGADFAAAGVTAGNVVYIKSTAAGLEGVFEVTGLTANDTIGVSVLRADVEDAPVAVGSASDTEYRIATFGPQTREACIAIRQYFRLDDEYDGDAWELRLCSTYAVIGAVYATLANDAANSQFYLAKSEYYQKLFVRARERAAAVVDNDGDGKVDKNSPIAVRIARA